MRKHNKLIDRLWEELCFACVGELFEHPDVVCVAVSTRSREDVISLWTSNTECQFVIGKKLKELCNLDESTQVDYKTFRSAIKDGSSFKNAKPYVYNAAAASAAAAGVTTNASNATSQQRHGRSDKRDGRDGRSDRTSQNSSQRSGDRDREREKRNSSKPDGKRSAKAH